MIQMYLFISSKILKYSIIHNRRGLKAKRLDFNAFEPFPWKVGKEERCSEGGYLGFYAPALTAQQLTAAGISAAAAGLPAAYAAAPTAATTPTAAQQAQPAETRTQ